MPADSLKQVGLFVGVVVLVVGAAAALPALQDDGGAPPEPNVTNEQFRPGDFPTGPETDGEIRMESDAANRTVLVDTGHGNDVSSAKVQTLVTALVENGHQVQFLGQRAREMNASLRRADALVVVNPTTRYTHDQARGVQAFAEAGGRVLVLSDPPRTRIAGGLFSISVEQIGGKTAALGSPLGVAVGDSYLYSLSENANSYKAVYGTATGDGELGAGVDRVVLRDAAPVTTDGDGRVVLRTEATLESTRRSDTFAVAVRNGNVTAVGDSDLLAPSTAYEADNEVLVGNLADFLVTGTKTPENAPEPQTPAGPGPGPGPGPEPGPGPGPGPGPEGPTPTPTPGNSTA
jgi:hypothetical protein